MESNLNFYVKPFRLMSHGNWVFDGAENFVFQFEDENYENIWPQIIEILNSENNTKIHGLNLKISESSPIWIDNDDKLFITIRGWGNLTGIGGHNLDSEVAIKIQDDFANWLISKLS
jgi:hypothetical protein